MDKKNLSSAQKEELPYLTELVEVTSGALNTLTTANINGNHVTGEQVAQVASDLVAMVSRAREIIAPKQ